MVPALRLAHDPSVPLRLAQVLLSDQAVGVLPAPAVAVLVPAGRPLRLEVPVLQGPTAPGEGFTVRLRSRLGPFQEPEAVATDGALRQTYLPPGSGQHDLVYDVVVDHWVRGAHGRRTLRRKEFVGTVPVQVGG